MTTIAAAIALSLLLVVPACAPRSIVPRAIRARGGPLAGFVRDAEAEVYFGFPGTWLWRATFLVPDRYAWTILTAGEPDHYLYDGQTVRTFVGGQFVGQRAGAADPLRTHARFTAVVNLDALLLPGVRLAPLASVDLPPDTADGVDVVFADDGSRYRVAFDARTLLVHAEGPVALPPLAATSLVARYADFRRTGRWWLPYRTDYTLEGRPLAVERTHALCPEPPGLGMDAFRSPAALPRCAVTGSRGP